MNDRPAHNPERALRVYNRHVRKLKASFNANAPEGKALVAARLRQMVEVDQYTLNYATEKLRTGEYSPAQAARFAKEMEKKWNASRLSHTESVKQLLGARPWFNISEFGAQADANAWLLVQHADHDPAFQKKILGVLEKLYPVGETRPENYAYLYDRVAGAEHRPEKYGTQGLVNEARTEWAPLEDPQNFETRVNALGLTPSVISRRQQPPATLSGWLWNNGKLEHFGDKKSPKPASPKN